jgi:hypothetical protein
MSRRFWIEDEAHAEPQSSHDTFEAAVAELRRLARIPWDSEPNRAPCVGWEKCGRRYEIHEYDTVTTPWTLMREVPALEINARGVQWTLGADGG